MLGRRWRLVIVSLVVVLVAAACGSNGGGDRIGQPDTTEVATSADAGQVIDQPDTTTAMNAGTGWAIDAEALTVGAIIVDRLGPDDGFAAVVLAFDRGYDAGQIINGAQTVTADGEIAGVAPSGPPYGLFTESAEAFGGAVVLAAGPTLLAAGGEITIEDLGRALERDFDAGAFLANPPADEPVSVEDRDMVEGFIGSILGLVDMGYSLDQIVEGLIFGELRVGVATNPAWRSDDNICVVLAANADLSIIPPKSQAGYSLGSTLNCRDAIDNNDSMGVLVQGEVVKASTTTTAPGGEPAEEEPEDASRYRVLATLATDPGEEFSWSGTFDVRTDGEIMGTGQGSAFAQGECPVGDGDMAPYSFTATWPIEVSGTADETSLDVILTPGTATISAGAGTDLSITCVEIGQNAVRAFTLVKLGGDGSGMGDIAVPVEGGTVTLESDPYVFTIIVTAP